MTAFFKQIWIFKSLTNFSIFGLFSSGSAYFYYRHQNDKKFDHPIFHESLRLLEQENQVIDLIGFPIYIDKGLKARATLTDKIINSSFQVKGPKGYLNIEIAGESKPQAAIENNLNRIQTLELTEEVKKTRLDELHDYYIPDPEILAEVDKLRFEDASKLDVTEIPKEMKFWKINYLFVDVSKDYRIVLLPKEASQKVAGKEIVSASSYKPNPWRKTLRQVFEEATMRSRLNVDDMGDKSEEELEEMRKFRMNETYKKVGYVRFYVFTVIVAGGMVGYILLQKYKRKNVLGNVLHSQALAIIKNNDFVRRELGKSPRFLQQVRGAEIDDEANFEIDAVGGDKVGTFKVFGKFDKKKNDWEIKNIEFTLKGRKGEELSKKKIF